MTSINHYVHFCIIQSGPMAGNRHEEEVSTWEVEARQTCDYCGEVLATPEQIALHIYTELTE